MGDESTEDDERKLAMEQQARMAIKNQTFTSKIIYIYIYML